MFFSARKDWIDIKESYEMVSPEYRVGTSHYVTSWKRQIFTARTRSLREDNVFSRVCQSFCQSVCPQWGVPCGLWLTNGIWPISRRWQISWGGLQVNKFEHSILYQTCSLSSPGICRQAGSWHSTEMLSGCVSFYTEKILLMSKTNIIFSIILFFFIVNNQCKMKLLNNLFRVLNTCA